MLSRRLRRALVIAGVVIATLAVLSVIALWVAYPRVGRWMVESKVVPRLEAKLGRDVTIGAIEIDHGHAVLRDVRVRGPLDGDEPLVRIDRIDVDFDFWASLTAATKIGVVKVQGVAVRPRRAADGQDNFRDVMTRLGLGDDDEDDGEGGARGGLGGLRPAQIVVRGGTLVFVDDAGGVTATVEGFEADWAPGTPAIARATGARVATTFGPEASAATLTAVIDREAGRRLEVSGGAVRLWPGMSLTGIAGQIAPRGHQLALELEGGYGGVEGRLWTASGWFDPGSQKGALDLGAARFTLDRLRPILEQSAVLDYGKASVDAELHVEVDGEAATFAGAFHLRDFTVAHPLLAEKPVPDLAIGGEIAGRLDRTTRVLEVERSSLEARGLPFQVTGWVAMPGGRVTGADGAVTRRERFAVDARFQVPKIPCQQALDAIPPELASYLQDYELKGNFDTDIRAAIDWSDLQATVLTGHVGIWGCKATKMPEEVERLKEPFEHWVELDKDQWMSFWVGPDNPDFVPIEEVSPYLLKSLMTTEDSRFYHHKGFIGHEFKSALVKNLEAGYFRYGASSITMQLVKNVLLYREKTLARKLQELFLTWHLETFLDKDRLFEIYVNVIEYGPGIYGIGPAAWHFFAKHPSQLEPHEAAFFSSILPAPKARYDQYCKGTLRKATETKIRKILEIMHKRDRLTDEELAIALETPLEFARDAHETEKQCLDRQKKAVKNARPTNPLKK